MDSLRKRYISKLGANSVSLFSGAIITLFVPKALGPAAFGIFNFITEFFNSIFNFLQFGTQNAFYTKLSKNQKDVKLIRFYSVFILLVVVASIILVIGIYIIGSQEEIWPDVQEKYVFAGLIFGILTFIVANVKFINDAVGITIFSEKIIILQKTTGLLLVLLLYYYDSITLNVFFLYHFFILTLLLSIWSISLIKRELLPINIRLTGNEKREYFKQFYKYSHPLILFTIISLIVDIGDRWLLQKFAGSVQQGYFSLAYRVSAICFLFTSAMTPLILREFSIAYKSKDMEGLSNLFKKNLPLLYFIGAYISVFVAFNTDLIIMIIGGSEYEAGSMAFMLMAFYPIQQTYGQLSGSLFFATDQTKLYRNIGVTVSIIGIITTFLLVAPKSLGGFDLGATGLAIKRLFIQFLGVSTGLYFNTKFLSLSFKKFMGHKILVVILLSVLAYSTNLLTEIIIFNNYLAFFVSGFLYTGLTIFLVFLYPRIIVQERKTIIQLVSPIFKVFKK